MRACWCGHDDLRVFNDDYSTCASCGTLVSQALVTDDQLLVHDDERDFYGKQYWLGHQTQDLGFPDVHARARHDLTERNLHWLRTLLKYRLPPASVVELGCAHGSFVALMRQAGYDASGIEMSAWVVQYGRDTFGVPIDVGPVERLELPTGSLDAIALFDVLEHLPDPESTMRHCLTLLKPGGVLLVQMPQFRDGMRYEVLLERDDAFVEMLKAEEHLYLYTERSARELFHRLGVEHLTFEPAIFAQYDMFFVAGKEPLQPRAPGEGECALMATSQGRFALALLDLRRRELDLADRLARADGDRTARGIQVESLTATLQEVERDRTARAEQIDTLDKQLLAAEHDRVERGQQIVALTNLLTASEADRAARADQIAVLQSLLEEAQADRAARADQIAALQSLLEEAEADRASRGAQLVTLTTLLTDAETDRAARGQQIAVLDELLRESESDRAARAEQITILDGLVRTSQADCAARGEQIETLTKMVHEAQARRDS